MFVLVSFGDEEEDVLVAEGTTLDELKTQVVDENDWEVDPGSLFWFMLVDINGKEKMIKLKVELFQRSVHTANLCMNPSVNQQRDNAMRPSLSLLPFFPPPVPDCSTLSV